MEDIRKKKILMTLMRLEIGGAETHVLELSLELARRGFEVVVASGGGVYEAHLKEAGIRHYTVPMYTKSPGKMFRSFMTLKKIIRDEKIDIVHGHGRIPAFLCGLLHPFMKFTFVTTAHWVFRTGCGLKYLSNWGEKVMAVSEDIKTYLMDNYGTNPSDIYVTINGIDTNRFSPDADFSAVIKEFDLSEDSKKIVYISRMDEDRAQVAFQLTAVATEIEKVCPGVEIVIVGGGNVFEKLKKEAEAVNEKAGRKLVTLTGARTDIDRFAAMSDIFIGVSRSALEAMACAKPVIVAGNEGYLGIFDEDKLQVGIDTNFCCRGLSLSSESMLLEDVKKVLSADETQISAWSRFSRETICKYYSVSKMALDCVEMYCAAAEEKKWDAVISGYYGYGNSGDEALLSAMISHLREKKSDIRLCVLSRNPKKTQAEHGVHAVNRYHYFAIIKALKSAKLFISGGGSLLQDVTSSKSLWYYLHLIGLAQKQNVPVMLYANGIGPIYKEKNRRKTAEVLQKVTSVTLREEDSMKEFLSLVGVETSLPSRVTADPALTICPAPSSEIDEILSEAEIPKEGAFLGISLRPWSGCDEACYRKIAESISELCKANNLTPVFIPMQYPIDYRFSEKVIKLLTVKAYAISKPLEADKMIGVISRMKLMISMRLHSLIYAASVSVPTVGLSYDPKIDAFMHYVDCGTAVDVESFDSVQFKDRAEQLLTDYDAMVERFAERTQILRDMAKDNAEIAIEIIRGAEGNCGYETDGN